MASRVVRLEASADVLRRWPRGRAALTGPERDRADAFGEPADRRDFLAAHLLARECVSALTGVPAAQVGLRQECTICGGPHGRPSVTVAGPDVAVSWSRTRGSVVAAAARVPIGVDVERWVGSPLGEHPGAGLLSRTMTAAESGLVDAARRPTETYLRLWVAKESLVKVGVVALDDFAGVHVAGVLDDDGETRWGSATVRSTTRGEVTLGLAMLPRAVITVPRRSG